jgi:hypothetical protein
MRNRAVGLTGQQQRVRQLAARVAIAGLALSR